MLKYTYIKSMLAVLVCGFFVIDYAAAQVRPPTRGEPPKIPQIAEPGDEFDWFASLTLSTDNRSQGFTASGEDPSATLEAGIIWNRFYVGISTSNVDFGNNAAGKDIADAELSYFLGYVHVLEDWQFDVNASYTTFPGSNENGGELNYFEFSAGVSRTLIDDLQGGLRVYYSPDYSGDTGNNWVFEGTLEKPLNFLAMPIFDLNVLPTLNGTIGYQDGEQNQAGFSYWFWSVGLDLAFNEHVSLDLRYHDAASVPFSCNDLCNAKFVVSLTIAK